MTNKDINSGFYEEEAEGSSYFYFSRRVCDDSDCTVPHFHAARELFFVKRGEVRVVVDGSEKTLREGEGCFTGAFGVHCYFPAAGSVTFCFVGDGEYFDFVLSSLGGVPPRFFEFDSFDLLDVLYENFVYVPQKCRRTAFIGALGAVMSVIAERYDFAPRKASGDEELIVAALKKVHENYTDDLSLESVSRELGYAPEYLSSVFHKYLREGFRTYLNRLRVRRADKMIRSGKSITEAAYESGFGSPQTFYRAYRKEYGSVPSDKKS